MRLTYIRAANEKVPASGPDAAGGFHVPFAPGAARSSQPGFKSRYERVAVSRAYAHRFKQR